MTAALEVSVSFSFDPIEVQGFGRSSAMKKTQTFVARRVTAVLRGDGRVECRWHGHKGGREVSDWFFSSDDALRTIRQLARRRASDAFAAASGQWNASVTR